MSDSLKTLCRLILLVCLFSNVHILPSLAGDLKDWGVLLLHGKGRAGGMDPVMGLLQQNGAHVMAPSMSWAYTYKTYDETLDEIGQYVRELKGQGVKKIAIIGQSLGSNMALGYANLRGGVTAVIANAPGHQPDHWLQWTKESLDKAKAMIAAGKGNEESTFTDSNQGRVYDIHVTAAAYYSFFDPNGKAVMAKNARAGGAKLLWVVGSYDRGAQSAARGGKIIHVDADHTGTVAAGAKDEVEWLMQQ